MGEVKMRTARKVKTMRELASIYRKAASVIEIEHSRRGLSLQAVASRVAAPPKELKRAFDEIGRTTFSELLTEVRMRHAADLLNRSQMSISAIAAEVGYSQTATFAKAFRRYIGSVPDDYRTINGRASLISY